MADPTYGECLAHEAAGGTLIRFDPFDAAGWIATCTARWRFVLDEADPDATPVPGVRLVPLPPKTEMVEPWLTVGRRTPDGVQIIGAHRYLSDPDVWELPRSDSRKHLAQHVGRIEVLVEPEPLKLSDVVAGMQQAEPVRGYLEVLL